MERTLDVLENDIRIRKNCARNFNITSKILRSSKTDRNWIGAEGERGREVILRIRIKSHSASPFIHSRVIRTISPPALSVKYRQAPSGDVNNLDSLVNGPPTSVKKSDPKHNIADLLSAT